MRNPDLDKKIPQLRTFFRISNAAFEFQNSIQLAISGHIEPNEMQQLHKVALFEIEKENPDLSLIDNLLAEMENLAELKCAMKNKKVEDIIEDIQIAQMEAGGRFLRQFEIRKMTVEELLNLLIPNNVSFIIKFKK